MRLLGCWGVLSVVLSASLSVFAADQPWSGTYTFTESAGTTQYWFYELNIDSKQQCNYQVDGHQTMTNVDCEVRSQSGKNEIVLTAIHDCFACGFAVGDTLFELSYNGKNLITTWQKEQPRVNSEQATPGHYFNKVK